MKGRLPAPGRRTGAVVAAAALLAGAAMAPAAGKEAPALSFKDVTQEAGVDFIHNKSATYMKYLAETMGSGAALLDYDMDGDLDLYMENGAPMPEYEGKASFARGLFRNEGDWNFTNVTEGSGLDNRAFGMGVCVGDYDNNGYPDIYAANFGNNALYRNGGDGTFRDASAAAGIGDARFGSSCSFLDADLDGDLDLVIVNYVDHTITNNKFCGDISKNVRSYCPPNVYNAEGDVFYENNGDGTFSDVSEAVGVGKRAGNGLGVTTGDYDDDGDMDIYVANDQSPNNLYRNDGGTFVDVGLLSGVAYNLSGRTQAGMGTDFGDFDGDGDLDLVVTNFDVEYNALYRNEGGGFFSDASFVSGVGSRSLNYLAFGVKFIDYDNDGLLDLVVANGHLMDNADYFNDATSFAQRNFFHHNLGNGKFEEVGLSLGRDMSAKDVSRGLATGDIDRDGDLDILFTVGDARPRLLRNDGGEGRASLRVRLSGTLSNRSAIGARGVLTVGDRRLLREVQGGTAYQSQSEFTLHFGLGEARKADSLEIRWPSGRRDRFRNLKPGEYSLVEGEEKLRR